MRWLNGVTLAVAASAIVTACAGSATDARFRASYRATFIANCLKYFEGTAVQKYAGDYCTCAGTELSRRLTTAQLTALGMHFAPKVLEEAGKSITHKCANQAARTTPQ
jgi:hypothetical protein